MTKNKVQQKLNCSSCGNEKKDRYCKFCNVNTANSFAVLIRENVGISESLNIKQNRIGLKGYIVQMFQGFKSSIDKIKFPNGVELYRKLDKERDWYDEVVRCKKINKIAHECHEPLSLHVGHGSAKK